jgi:glycerol-3-phosphate O-acyltransferase
VPIATTFANPEHAIEDALEQFKAAGFISEMGAEEGEEDEFAEVVYSLDEEKRLHLEYYKNNILHFFVPLSFVAGSILSTNEEVDPAGEAHGGLQVLQAPLPARVHLRPPQGGRRGGPRGPGLPAGPGHGGGPRERR